MHAERNASPVNPGVCECGCGQPVKRRFVSGHNRRGVGYHLESISALCDRILKEDRGFSSPCWIWQGKIATNGYGNVKRNKSQRVAHKVFYEELKGPVPEGLDLDHLCRVRACVNPDHLEPVTRSENCRRGAASKLTDEQVKDIHRRRQLGEPVASLAKEFGVRKGHIYFLGVHGPHVRSFTVKRGSPHGPEDVR